MLFLGRFLYNKAISGLGIRHYISVIINNIHITYTYYCFLAKKR